MDLVAGLCKRLPKEVVDAFSLGMFKVRVRMRP